jgi:preprotein translocase subunit Sss1
MEIELFYSLNFNIFISPSEIINFLKKYERFIPSGYSYTRFITKVSVIGFLINLINFSLDF